MDIYLDQNHWIALARASAGKEKNKEAVELSLRILDAVRREKVRLPLSSLNIVELTKIGDADRRKRLAVVFVEYSQGWVLSPPSVVIELELEALGKGNCKPVAVIRRGIMAAMESYQTAARSLGVTAQEPRRCRPNREEKEVNRGLLPAGDSAHDSRGPQTVPKVAFL